MENNNYRTENTTDRRSEPREEMVDQYHSVEISIKDMAAAYIFKLRDISSAGMGILVQEGSDLLNHIFTGQMINVKYNPGQQSGLSKYFKTEIRHITKGSQDRLKGHFIIGLQIIESIEETS